MQEHIEQLEENYPKKLQVDSQILDIDYFREGDDGSIWIATVTGSGINESAAGEGQSSAADALFNSIRNLGHKVSVVE